MPTEPEIQTTSSLRRAFMLHLAPPLALIVLRLLSWSWRYRETDREFLDQCLSGDQLPILAFFHGRSFVLLTHMTKPDHGHWIVMCSRSLDGEVVARVQERLGVEVVRGSSGHGGKAALKGLVRRVRNSASSGGAIAVDGSRGPRGRVQAGVLSLASLTRRRILPITTAASPAWIFRRSWDRALLPKPFARVDIVYGEPIDLPPTIDATRRAAFAIELEERLVELQRQADALSGFRDEEPVRAPA